MALFLLHKSALKAKNETTHQLLDAIFLVFNYKQPVFGYTIKQLSNKSIVVGYEGYAIYYIHIDQPSYNNQYYIRVSRLCNLTKMDDIISGTSITSTYITSYTIDYSNKLFDLYY